VGAWGRGGKNRAESEEKPTDTGTPFDAFHLLRAGGDTGTRGKNWRGRVREWVRGRKSLGHGGYGETKEKPTGRLSDLTKEQNQGEVVVDVKSLRSNLDRINRINRILGI